MKITIIGAGHIGSAIATCLAQGYIFNEKDITITNQSPDKFDSFVFIVGREGKREAVITSAVRDLGDGNIFQYAQNFTFYVRAFPMKRTDDVYDRHIFFYNRFGVFVEFSLYDAQRVSAG